jgi:putative ABC transport system ATP-binding protein
MITLSNVKKEYTLGQTKVSALRGVNLALEQGKYYSIVGPSGSGKSSLLHIIGCVDVPSSGQVQLSHKDVSDLNERELTKIRAREIGFIFQAFHLNPILTAKENVSIALRFLGVSKAEANRRAEACLAKVGLSHRLDHYPAELSGGERQRVAIARAIVKNPNLILADEPTGNLDSQTGLEIINLIRSINLEQGTTIVQVTHDLEIAAMSDDVVSLRDGKVV